MLRKKYSNPPTILSLAKTKSVWIAKCTPLIKFIQWFRFIQSMFLPLPLSCFCYTIRPQFIILFSFFYSFFLFQIWNNFLSLSSSLRHHLSLHIVFLSSLESLSSLLFPSSRPTTHLLLCISSLLHLCSSLPTSSRHESRTVASFPSLSLPSSDLSPPRFRDEMTSPPILCENYSPLLCESSATWRVLCLSPPCSLFPVMSLFLCAPPSSPPLICASKPPLLHNKPKMAPPLGQPYISSSLETALLLVESAMAARWRTTKLGLGVNCIIFVLGLVFLIRLFCNYFNCKPNSIIL